MADNTRARKGGQYGKNGEFYQGGQFLPSSETTVKGEFSRDKKAATARKPRKVEIAPYKWVTTDQDSIWKQVEMVCKFHKTGYSKENGAEGWLEVLEGPMVAMGWSAEAMAETVELAERWNKGERLI